MNQAGERQHEDQAAALTAAELVRDDRVHRRVFTDASVFDLEMERIFARSWVFIGHDSEVPAQGDWRTRWIGRQPAIMIRHRDATVRVVMNRCMHRGAVLCRAEAGNAREFECPYHGWLYDTDGTLKHITDAEAYPGDLDRAALSLLAPAATANVRGFVFATLNPAAPAIEAFLGPAAALIDSVADSGPEGRIDVSAGMLKYGYDGNWKLQIENWMDNYHPNFTHRTAFESRTGLLDMRRAMPGAIRALPYGHGYADYAGFRPSYPASKPGYDEYVRRMEAAYGAARAHDILTVDVQFLIFPNLFFQPANGHFRIVRPVAVDRTEVLVFPYRRAGAPDSFNDAMIRSAPWWASPAGFGQPDDMDTLERCQIGLQVSGAEWSLIARGIGRERRLADGTVIGEMMDETLQRGIYREWRRLMMAPS